MIENEYILQPAPENSDSWHDIETAGGCQFRWTSTELIAWEIPILSGVNLISLPYVNEITNGFSKGCSILVDGVEVSPVVRDNLISFEIKSELPALVKVVMIQPDLISPVVFGSDDNRRLGLAVKIF